MSSELASTLHAGSCLIDTLSTPQTQLKSALLQRLQNYYSCLGSSSTLNDSATLENVQIRTADEALVVVEKVQRLLRTNAPDTGAPLLGTRDLNQLRVLLSITFRWGVDPLLSHVISSWPNTSSSTVPGAKIIDLTSTPEDYHHLANLVARQLTLVFPLGIHGNTSNTLITEVILQRHLPDILKPAISLGWLPKSLAVDTMTPLDDIRPLIMRLMAMLPPVESMVALGSVMSSTNSVPHIRRTCGYLMSRQLLRPEGVKGLCAAVFGDSENVDDIQLDKLQHISRVLITVPAGMVPKDYFSIILPRLIDLLQESRYPAYRRAAAFALSQMLAVKNGTAAQIILFRFHDLFLYTRPDTEETDVTIVLGNLTTVLTNSDPSPELISTLLSPIVRPLYGLLFHLDSIRTSDPELKEMVRGLLLTWSRITSSSEAIDTLWTIFDDEGGQWHTDLEGGVRRGPSVPTLASTKLSLFTPETLKKANEAGELDPTANILDLYPEPRHLAVFLKSMNRDDILSQFLVKLLEGYRDNKNSEDGNPVRTLLYLQLIMQLQIAVSDSSKSAGLFSKPSQILTFIKQALEAAASARPEPNYQKKKVSLAGKFQISDLRLSPQDEEDPEVSDGDSDDDLSDSEAFTADNEMEETSITLLLSVLEANENLSARTEPILNDIFELLEPRVNHSPSAVRLVAREARMVMTARLALGDDDVSRNNAVDTQAESPREIYQKALKFLQDPILPVRAHGLLLLRQLASASTDSAKMDSALVPAVLEIFVQSIQDDDSYIFLNAVQGLAALVDNYDRSILKRLVYDYTKHLDGLEAGNMNQQDVDTRIRLGEALSMVIRRCGETLGATGNVIIPPLLRVIRSPTAPTTLRTSSLSLLADCQNTYALAVLPYLLDLAEGMIDLLQVETTSTTDNTTTTKSEEGRKLTMDDHPTSTNTKFPPLRRAALHFLTLLIRGTTKEIYESYASAGDNARLSVGLTKRMRITLGYISNTDDDMLVRVMAREALEDLAHLELAKLTI
ncbi:uncharacterized protein C8R40DRAFT_1035206 [Lentinula edodes]|uniref:uncharacterized protein n=1 Tax=Lentinula edodes TaxID=5353 RepID=UPI001E8D8C5C|nr:uncharacterized protein C8R40DRAFT_1035206 [Lentinula edodes]KAH7879787.1 hypothetical protein C8R40DRAFT_1035206 [Lentinula edodes]